MRRFVFLISAAALAALFCVFLPNAESKKDIGEARSDFKPQFFHAAAFGISQPVSSIPPEPGKFDTPPQLAESKNNKFPRVTLVEGAIHDTESSLAQTSAVPMPTPSLSFDGLSNFDNLAVYNAFYLPPDTIGDVGPNHYVQAVNILLRIYDKTGTALTPPFKMSNIFAPLGTACSTRNDGDPIVQYDQLADRWILSQFCTAFPPFRQMIAVSKTGDPSGQYFIYEFVMPNNKLNDYPKIGVWPDAYYMSTDEFVGSDYAGSGMFAFDRAKMLAGDPSAVYVYFSFPAASVNRFGGMLPSDLDGLRPPPTGVPNVFVSYRATEYLDPFDAIRLFDFRSDFANPLNSTFSERPESAVPVSAFDPTSPDGRPDIFQPPPGEFLDSQSDRLMYRIAYRNFGAHESLVFNQTVRVTPVGQTYRAGVRVYELRRAGGGPFAVAEQTTIGTTDSSRWMAAAAQDHQGDLAVGYSQVSDMKEPSIIYSGKLAGEPAGSFRPETELIVGTGVQKAFGWRWGDYSGMNVDPVDDCIFWLTNQYYTQESEEFSDYTWLTRIGKFKFAECTPAPKATITGIVTNSSNSAPVQGAAVTAASYTRLSDANGSYGSLFVLPGTYNVTASAHGFRPRSFTLSPVNGQIITQNFSLDPIPVLINAGVQITSESCAMNNAAEPGETVTMQLSLRNTGQANTSNLTAALLPGGGVVNPSGPQNYGVLTANGPSVSRPFTFTVSPNLNCGRVANLIFRLQDGADFVQHYTLDLQTGAVRIALEQNFDSVSAPSLPAGWTSIAEGAQLNWTTSATRRESMPNSAFSPAPFQVGVNELASPVFPITTPNAKLSFRNWYELETTFLRNRLYDGAVLEIKIGNERWEDIITAGGVFESGGYDGVIDGCCQNPLAGRRGWSGRSGINQTSEFITSAVRLPAAAAGQNIQLRWRVGTDIGTFREGQYIDNLVVSDGYVCGCPGVTSNAAPFDFDGDSRTDLSVFRPSDNPAAPDFFIQNSSNGSLRNENWGVGSDIPATADFDGDGKTDIAVFRPSAGTWFILRSSDLSVSSVYFGIGTDRLVPADFDGDDKADVAVFRDGWWYVLRSSNGQFFGQQFGTTGDRPVQADYDGDGRADLAVFRPSNGAWYVSRSSDNGFQAVQFGMAGDKLVAGDFDGDGRADYVVFRPSNANWYLLRSSAGFAAVQFGIGSDLPLQADFDGDGTADIAVYRPAVNNWYYLKSTGGGFEYRVFAQSGDIVLPSIFVN